MTFNETKNNHNGPAHPKKIWIDLDNSPHVPFFVPIIEELTNCGYKLYLTARDSYQVCELLNFYEISGTVVGRHYGKWKILKVLGTGWRALRLAALVRAQKPDIAVSHGSRACVLASALLRIPSITIFDYEFASGQGVQPTWVMMPAVIPNDSIETPGPTILKYPGIKEDVYLSRFNPDPELRIRLGIAPDDLLIMIRPPATEAHYHNPESEKLLAEALNRFARESDTRVLLLPRSKKQAAELRTAWAEAVTSGKIVIPEHVEDGLNLIWNSDLVISGGGTMNREAAAMRVPVYSIFRGKTGAVDRYLADQGRLVLLETVEDVRTKIKAVRRQKSSQHLNEAHSPALETIVHNIISIVESKAPVPRKALN